MHLVIGRIEVVIHAALFFKCRFWTGEVPELKLRVPLRHMLLKSPCYTLIRAAYIVDYKNTVFCLPQRIRSC